MNSGIYAIRNIINGNCYIGSSKNLSKRKYTHFYNLRVGKHVNCKLQRAWQKHGSDSFIFEILENCNTDILFEREQFYFDSHNSYYNIGKEPSGGDNLSNNPNRIEIIKKIKKSINLRVSAMTLEDRQKISDRVKGSNNPNFNNKWSIEKRKKLSIKLKAKNIVSPNKGKKLNEIFSKEKADSIKTSLSNYAKLRSGINNPFYGKKHKESTKEKIRKSRVGKSPTNIKSFYIDENFYTDLYTASSALNIPYTTIQYRLKSKNFTNYYYTAI